MNKKKITILTVIVLVVIISTIVIGFTLYNKSVRHEEVKQYYDNMPCDAFLSEEFLSADFDRNAEFEYLYEQKLKDCLEMQNESMNIETVYVKILKGAVIEGHQMLDPELITVQIGVNNTITWINEDDVPHGISSDNKEHQWGSAGVIKPGESFTHTFEDDGVFPYHGEPHPWMTGFVIVLDSDPPQKHELFDITDVFFGSESYKDYGINTNFPFEKLGDGVPEQLERVLQSCEYARNARANNYTSPDGTPYSIAGIGYQWNNSTHHIDNGTCQFMTLEEYYSEIFIGTILEYCNSSSKAGWDNPYNLWFANQTHYLDSDICLWQNLGDGITLVLPTDWENIYIENHE